MVKWEYYILKQESFYAYDEFFSDIEELGKAGWELVCVTPNTGHSNPIAYFKRAL